MSIGTVTIDGREYILIPKDEFELWQAQGRPAQTEPPRQRVRAFVELAGEDVIDPEALRELREASRA